MFDTHCHLDRFIHISSTIHNSQTSINSVPFTIPLNHHYLAVSTIPDKWLSLLEFAQNNPYIHSALGIHPWFVSESSIKDVSILRSFIQEYSVTALGEIGLDFKKPHRSDPSIQLKVFEAQLKMAVEFNLPVSLHIVKAHNEALQLLQEYPVKGVVHGLGSSIEVAQRYVDLGFKFGVNGVCLRANACRYHRLITHFGLEHIVLETDFPNITLPGLVESSLDDIEDIATHIASLLDSTTGTVITQTDDNAHHIFCI